jgi:PAS domain S-box-containing protein
MDRVRVERGLWLARIQATRSIFMHVEASRVRAVRPSGGSETYVLSDVWKILVLAIVYFVSGKLGLELAFLHRSASPVWPPTGIALAALLVFGYRLWPGVWLGAFLVNITTAGSIFTTIGIAAGNTFEAVLGAWLVDRFANGRCAFEQAGDIFRYVLVAPILSTAVSATFGVTSLALGGYAAWAQYGAIWGTWWLGDAVSALIVAPFLLIWFATPFPQWNRRQVSEAILLLAVVLGVSTLGFNGPFSDLLNRYPRFLLYPAVLLAAYRFEQRGAISAALIVSGVAIWGTQHGYGPFASANRNDSLVLLQAYLSTLTLTNLVLGAVVFENRQHESALQENQERTRRDLEDTLRLQEVSRRFVQHEDSQALMEAFLDAAIAITDAERGTFQLADPNTGMLKIVAQRGFQQAFLDFFAEVHNDGSGAAMHRDERVIVEDVAKSEIFVGTPSMGVLLDAGVRAVQSSPLFSRSGVLVGMLNTHYNAPHQLERRESQMLDLLVRQAADLIERNRAVAELRESEARFRHMAEAAPVMIWMSGTNKLCTYVNSPWLEFTGKTLEEQTGQGWAERVHPDDRERCREIYTTSFDARREFQVECRLQRSDGEYRWVLCHGIPRFASADEFLGYIGSCIDITERKQAEQALAHLAAIVRSSDDAIIGRDLKGTITSWNAGAERLFGYSAKEVIGKPSSLLHPPDHGDEERRIVAALRRGETTEHYETVRIAKDGRRIDVALTISPIRNADGTVIGSSKIARDISERKRIEAELEAWRHELELRVEQRTVELAVAHKQLQAQIDERKRLEAEIARAIETEQLRLGQELHDGLGQQLAGMCYMLGALKVKLERTSEPTAQEVQKIEKLLLQSVEQVRNLAKGFYPVELERRGLFFALREIAHTTEQSFGVRCTVRVSESDGIEPKGPPAIQLFRIAQEAVYNAIKHAKAKHIAIQLITTDGRTSLTIQDDGVGLPPSVGEAKGMGLRIMDYRAKMIGAQFDLHRGPGGGTIVACSLPVTPAEIPTVLPESPKSRSGDHHVTA